MNAPDLADVLAEVNRLRAEREMDPLDAMPKATGDAPTGCPIALAFEGTAGEVTATPGKGSPIVPLPSVITAFIGAFDRDEYPELMADG